jgi:NADH dehydrogenase
VLSVIQEIYRPALAGPGERVITLTNSPGRYSSLSSRVKAMPFNFDRPAELERSLEGVDVLYNTYWVRFNHPTFTHADGVRNTLILFEAAQKAGVRRIVHISITNPREASPLEYFSGKAHLERVLRESGLSYAILRPTVLFGKEDILINNIAWALRRLPVFGVLEMVPSQPLWMTCNFVRGTGDLRDNVTVNAIGLKHLMRDWSGVPVSSASAACCRCIALLPGRTPDRRSGDDVMITRRNRGSAPVCCADTRRHDSLTA